MMFRILRSSVHKENLHLFIKCSPGSLTKCSCKRLGAEQEICDGTPKTQALADCRVKDRRRERDPPSHCGSSLYTSQRLPIAGGRTGVLGKTTLRSWLPGPEGSFSNSALSARDIPCPVPYRHSKHSLNALLSTPKRKARQKGRKRSLEPQKARGQDWIARGTPQQFKKLEATLQSRMRFQLVQKAGEVLPCQR